jgi:hypothetical protein
VAGMTTSTSISEQLARRSVVTMQCTISGDETIAEWRRRRSSRQASIVATRPIGAPAGEVLRFLGDLANHVELGPGSVEVMTLEPRPEQGARAIVRLTGPLAIRRTAVTELLPARVPDSVIGRARIGRRTMASVAWRVHRGVGGSAVTLCATIDEAGPLDALLLRLGGRRWLERRFAAALDHLSDQLAPAATASPQSAPVRRAA